MSSQEEYLDQLLKDMLDGDREEQSALGGFDADLSDHKKEKEYKDRYELEDLDKLSLDDVNQILEDNAKAAKTKEDLESLDLLELLDRSIEDDLLEIKDVLEKADHNEPVDERIAFLIEESQKSEAELPQDLLEQMQETDEDEEEENPGLINKILGKKKKKKPKKKLWEKKKTEDFDYEMIELFDNMELIDGEENNKSWLEKAKDKLTAKKAKRLEAAKEQEKEKKEQSKAAKEGEKSKKRKRKGKNSLNEALSEMETQPEDVLQLLDNEILKEEGHLPEDTTETGELVLPEDMSAGEGSQSDALNALDVPEATFENMDEIADELAQIREKDPKENAEEKEADNGLGLDLSGDLFEGMEEVPAVSGDENLDDLLEIATKDDKKKDGKKKGFFAKIFEFLTEEDEEEKKEDDELILSDENDAILKELDKEGKKKKKKIPKKGKAEKEGGDEEEEGTDKKGKKEKKPKKPKKEKKPKPQEVEEPGKKLSKRRVTLIFLVCIALGGAFLVLSNVTIDFTDKKKASAAFQAGNYEECYQNLVGKTLNEGEQVMFGKSESILRIRLWMREYEMLVEQGQEPEALDSLMQSVHDYPTLYAFSGKWNAVSEVQAVFDQMLDILLSKYGLSEEEAKLIANEEDDLLYSKMVRTIAGGGSFGDWETPGMNGTDGDAEQDGMDGEGEAVDQDLLPEEEEMQDIPFVD